MGLLGGSDDKGSVFNTKLEFSLWVWKITWRRKWLSHSSILAWRIPVKEEPGGLQSIGSQSDLTEVT